MIWRDGLTNEEKLRRKKNWHKWFAWFPVTIGVSNDHHKFKCWLQYTLRRGRIEGRCIGGDLVYVWEYDYKFMDSRIANEM